MIISVALNGKVFHKPEYEDKQGLSTMRLPQHFTRELSGDQFTDGHSNIEHFVIQY